MLSFSMHLFVAFGAQGNQILFHIATGLAAELEVMHLQVLHAAADLASPAVAFLGVRKSAPAMTDFVTDSRQWSGVDWRRFAPFSREIEHGIEAA